MSNLDQGAPQADGLSQAEPEVSALRASIPSAWEETMAQRLWFDDCDQMGWPNGRPTWTELLSAAERGDRDAYHTVTCFRSYATAARDVATHYPASGMALSENSRSEVEGEACQPGSEGGRL